MTTLKTHNLATTSYKCPVGNNAIVINFTTNHGSQYGKQTGLVDNDRPIQHSIIRQYPRNGGRLFIQGNIGINL
jgi:hypothetical protein